MNSIDEHPNYKKLYSLVRKLFTSSEHFSHGPYDETYYTLRVYETSKELIRKTHENVLVPLVLTASILHDVGKTKLDTRKLFPSRDKRTKSMTEWNKHQVLGVPIARQILKKLGHSQEFIEHVCELVLHHDDRRKTLKRKTIELQLLQDADIIADCGFAGVLRPFLYGSKFKRPIIGSIHYLQHQPNRAANKKLLNLPQSKRMAKRKVLWEKRFIQEITKDIKSDLIRAHQV